ncbi:MAG: hypothetical protein HY913_19475 [Desulfomonile tiedjei]|nr:hypothetical protein [Desulfomonile tiedjei]
MKKIIALGVILALLTPVYVHASDSSSRLELEKEWRIRQAQQKQEDARFKAIDAEAAKAFDALGSKADAGIDRPVDSK